MKKLAFFVAVLMVVVMTAGVCMAGACASDCANQCCETAKKPCFKCPITGMEIQNCPVADKFGRGILNACFGWTVPLTVAGQDISKKTEFNKGVDNIIWGALHGFCRTGGGIVDIVTCWVPGIPQNKMYKDTPFDLMARANEGKKIIKKGSCTPSSPCGTTPCECK